MRASHSVALVEDVATELLKALPHLISKLRRTVRNADVTGMVGKMIADDRSALPSTVDDLGEHRGRLLLRRLRMCGNPIVHFGDVRGRTVRVKKLGPVLAPSFGHELGLSLHRAPAAGDSNVGSRKFSLDRRDQRINVHWTRHDR